MSFERTSDGRVVLYLRATGQRFERWPVDAREMMASGAYTADPTVENAGDDSEQSREASAATVTATASVSPAVDPMPHVTEANRLNAAVTPTGAPLVIAPSSTVTKAAPLQLPTPGTRQTRKGR